MSGNLQPSDRKYAQYLTELGNITGRKYEYINSTVRQEIDRFINDRDNVNELVDYLGQVREILDLPGDLDLDIPHNVEGYLFLMDAVLLAIQHGATDIALPIGLQVHARFIEAALADAEAGVDPTAIHFGPEDVPQNQAANDRAVLNDSMRRVYDRAESGTLGDPLIVDIGHDGIHLIHIDQAAIFFDIDADGYLEKTAWIGPDDAILGYDRNSDGRIDGINEIFGTATISGHTELEALDSNSDGVINVSDTEFSKLMLWFDLNGNGRFDDGEGKDLGDYGINSFDLQADWIGQFDGLNYVTERFDAQTDEGTLDVYDVWFAYDDATTTPDPAASFPDGITLTSSALGAVFLRGSGNLSNTVLSALQNADIIAASNSLRGIDALDIGSPQFLMSIEAYLMAWAGIQVEDPLYSNLSAQDYARAVFLESYFGEEIRPDIDGNVNVAVQGNLDAAWNNLLVHLAPKIVFQLLMENGLYGVHYNYSGEFAYTEPFVTGEGGELSVLDKSLFRQLTNHLYSNIQLSDTMSGLLELEIATRVAMQLGEAAGLSQTVIRNVLDKQLSEFGLDGLENTLAAWARYTTDVSFQTYDKDQVIFGAEPTSDTPLGIAAYGNFGSDIYVVRDPEDSIYINRTAALQPKAITENERNVFLDFSSGQGEIWLGYVGISNRFVFNKLAHLEGSDLVISFLYGGFTEEFVFKDYGTKIDYSDFTFMGGGNVGTGTARADDIIGGYGQGKGGDDRFFGVAKTSEEFDGGGGNDVFYGLGGPDRLNGGRGDDLFFLADGQGETVDGGKGFDRVSYVLSTARITIDLAKGYSNLPQYNQYSAGKNSGDAKNDTYENIEKIVGTKFDDVIVVDHFAWRVSGQKGDDRIVGNEKPDILSGGRGKDQIKGGDGNDKLAGEEGRDTLWGQKGNDKLTGGPDADTFKFGKHEGRDVVTDFKHGEDELDLRKFGFANKKDALVAFYEIGARNDDIVGFMAKGTTIKVKGLDLKDINGHDILV